MHLCFNNGGALDFVSKFIYGFCMIFTLNSTNQLVFVIQTQYVSCEVEIGYYSFGWYKPHGFE